MILKRYKQELQRSLRLPHNFDFEALLGHFLGYTRQLFKTLVPGEDVDMHQAVINLGRQIAEVYQGVCGLLWLCSVW